MAYKYSQKQNYKKLAPFLLIAAALLIVGSYFGYKILLAKNNTSSVTQDTSSDGINLNPPTEEEKSSGNDIKEDIPEDGITATPEQPAEQDAPDGSTQKSVKPIITSAGQFDSQIEVRSFIPGIYESSGTCTVVFTQNNNRIERQVEGIQDATTTRCDTVTILREDFPNSGTWTVKVNYSSPSSKGESDVSTFEVK